MPIDLGWTPGICFYVNLCTWLSELDSNIEWCNIISKWCQWVRVGALTSENNWWQLKQFTGLVKYIKFALTCIFNRSPQFSWIDSGIGGGHRVWFPAIAVGVVLVPRDFPIACLTVAAQNSASVTGTFRKEPGNESWLVLRHRKKQLGLSEYHIGGRAPLT